jgi:hypothetical protein
MTNFVYKPEIGIQINMKEIRWGGERGMVRKLLDNSHKGDDRTVSLGETDLQVRRDIYANFNHEKNYFFLNYDADDRLNEVELHDGGVVEVQTLRLEFGKDVFNMVADLKRSGFSSKETEQGQFLFEDLKMVIATSDAMGGDGNGLAYVYVSNSISHLLDEL